MKDMYKAEKIAEQTAKEKDYPLVRPLIILRLSQGRVVWSRSL